MAGFDLDNQFSGTIPGGGRIDFGYAEFSVAAYNLDVATRLEKIRSYGVTIAVDPSSGRGSLNTASIWTDCDVSKGTVTFHREAIRDDISQGFYYQIFGY